MNLMELLKRTESKTLEFKRDLSSPAGILRTIIAFANAAGGTLLLGVDDAGKHVRGISDPLPAEERLANLISDSIEPRLVPDLKILPWRRTTVVAVKVYPSSTRPHFLKSKGIEGGTYVRVGSTNRRADRELIEGMKRFTLGETFDEQRIPDLDSEAIDFRAASELFSPHRKLTRRDLKTLRLVAIHQGRIVPTVGGLLLFGKERADRFPDAWIQVGRFRGKNKAHLIDHTELRSFPVKAVEEAIEFVRKHTLLGVSIGSVRRRERWSLPPVAVREAIINAVVHTDYSQRGAPIRVSLFDDRLEVENPGLLPLGLTVDDLRRGVSKLRNRVFGRVFHELELIEQWGSGIHRMSTACEEAGLAPPELEELGARFRVTFPTERIGTEVALDETDQAILDGLERSDGLLTSEIARIAELSRRATRTRLAKLVERGFVYEIGTSPQDPKRRYFRTENQ